MLPESASSPWENAMLVTHVFGRHLLGIAAIAAGLAASGCGGQAALPVRQSASSLVRQSDAHLPIGGTTFATIFGFDGTDGGGSVASMIDVKGTLYGTTAAGGNGNGTVFSVSPSGNERVLYTFAGGSDASYPAGNLVYYKGLLYGTSELGGANGDGAVFSVSLKGAEKVIYSFAGGSSDGALPNGGLVVDGDAFYGTTLESGPNYQGTVFKVTPAGAETVIHGFGLSGDGAYPAANLILANGTMYGTTYRGGTSGDGSVFSIAPDGTEGVVYSFAPGTDGANPQSPLVELKGALYGTTFNGGVNSAGAIFKVTTAGKETVLHSFGATGDGVNPYAGLTVLKGKLYGTTGFGGTASCGAFQCGTLFSVTPTGTETVLHSFGGSSDGEFPEGGLTVLGKSLYGTTSRGGVNGGGTIFALSP
jgi:uncharacterized repeat protein (TIGR03803 family)